MVSNFERIYEEIKKEAVRTAPTYRLDPDTVVNLIMEVVDLEDHELPDANRYGHALREPLIAHQFIARLRHLQSERCWILLKEYRHADDGKSKHDRYFGHRLGQNLFQRLTLGAFLQSSKILSRNSCRRWWGGLAGRHYNPAEIPLFWPFAGQNVELAPGTGIVRFAD